MLWRERMKSWIRPHLFPAIRPAWHVLCSNPKHPETNQPLLGRHLGRVKDPGIWAQQCAKTSGKLGRKSAAKERTRGGTGLAKGEKNAASLQLFLFEQPDAQQGKEKHFGFKHYLAAVLKDPWDLGLTMCQNEWETGSELGIRGGPDKHKANKNAASLLTNWQWFSVVWTLIYHDLRHRMVKMLWTHEAQPMAMWRKYKPHLLFGQCFSGGAAQRWQPEQ